MQTQKNSNIYVGERAYQMSRFLTFRSPAVEQRFKAETFTRTKYFLQGYILICLLYLVWRAFTSTCFLFHHSCKHIPLLLLSMLVLVLSFIPIRAKRPVLLRTLILIPCLYIHLLLLDQDYYYLSVHLIVVHTTFANVLVLHTWKSHTLFNLLSYGLLALSLRYMNIEYIVNGSAFNFFKDLLIYNLLALIITAFIEKGRRERWVLVETFKKSERSFVSLVERFESPVFVLDNNKRILFANQKGLAILQKYFKMVGGKVPLQKLNINFVSLLALSSKTLFEKALEESTFEKGIKTKVLFKDPDLEIPAENPNMTLNIGNMLDTRVQNLIQEWNHIYEVDCVRTLWKTSPGFMVSIQDITNNVKLQTVMSLNNLSLIQNIRNYIEAAQVTFESLPNLSLLGTYRPLINAISNMDNLQYSLLNTSIHKSYKAAFDIAVEKFKMEREVFDIRDILVYMLEILSIKSCKHKNEMNLRFEAAFPDKVKGDSLRFSQLLHNLLTNIVDHSRETKIDISCNLKTMLTQGKYLLEFKIDFSANESLNYENIRNLLALDDSEISIDILKKNEMEPLLKRMEGSVRVMNKAPRIEIHFELPFDNNASSSPNSSNCKDWNLPLLSKFILTNTRTKINRNHFTWGAQPFPISTEKSISESAQSPYIMKERLSERIKQQFSESQSSATLSNGKSTGPTKPQPKAPTFQEFQKQKMTLLKFTGKAPACDSSAEPLILPEPSKPESRVLEQKPEDKMAGGLHLVGKSPRDTVIRETTDKLGEKISLNIKRQNSVRKKQEAQKENTIQRLSSTHNSHQEEEGGSNDKPANDENRQNPATAREVPKIEVIPPPVEKEESKREEVKNKVQKMMDVDEFSLKKGIERVKKGRKKNKSEHRVALSDNEGKRGGGGDGQEFKNHYKPIRPSFFSPISPQGPSAEPLSQRQLLAAGERRLSSNSEVVDEDVYYSITRNKLKIYENNLKIAVGNILLGILTMYGRKGKSSAASSHSKIMEKEEKKKEEESEQALAFRYERELLCVNVLYRDEQKGKGSFNTIDGDEGQEGNDVDKIIKDTFMDGKLKANEFLDRIIELLASRLSIEKNEKEFMVFLVRYVKAVERKILQQDYQTFPRGSMQSFEEEEERFDNRITFSSYTGGFPGDPQPGGFPCRRKNSDDSVFSLNSDAAEKTQTLSERMLVTPSVMALIRLKGDMKKAAKKKFTTPGEISEEDQPSYSGTKQKGVENFSSKFEEESSNVEEEPGKSPKQLEYNEEDVNEKEDRSITLNPFNMPIESLPAFLKVRFETKKRKWICGHVYLREEDFKEFHYLEDFTILVVDDNSFVLKGLELAPCPFKKSLDYAKNGLEGFKKFKNMIDQQCLYHLILMDVMMPTCDGLEATKMIRDFEAANNYPRTYICAVSSFEDEATRRRCFEVGMDDYCCKPVGPQTLTRLITSRCKSLGIDPKKHEDDTDTTWFGKSAKNS